MNVFLSYSHQDSDLASSLSRALKERGATVWSDEEILPGENWAQKLGEALENSDTMIVLVTPAAMGSTQVHREIDFALTQSQYKSRLIPVVVDGRGTLDESTMPWILKRLTGLHMKENPADTADEIYRLVNATAQQS